MNRDSLIGWGLVAIAIGWPIAATIRRRFRAARIVIQQAAHPHPSGRAIPGSFDEHAEQALAVANGAGVIDRTGWVICDGCAIEQSGRPLVLIGQVAPGWPAHYLWECLHCPHVNHFGVEAAPTTPRRGK